MFLSLLYTLFLLPYLALAAVKGATVASTILVIATSNDTAFEAVTGLQGYGIPYQVLAVPQAGATLPALNSSATVGKFGGIVIISGVTYGYTDGTGWHSALTDAQMTTIYNYSTNFGARLVWIDVYPTSQFGVAAAGDGGGCCGAGVEQFVYLTDTSAFSTAGLKTGATLSTQGLWHTPATITDKTNVKQIAAFGPTSDGTTFTTNTTAAVIQTVGSRQQMVFFTGWGAAWSPTTNFLQHVWIKWVTRGVHAGYRRTYFGTQVDDMMLKTLTFDGNGTTFRSTPADMDIHVAWQTNLNKRLPTGSNYTIEMAHNGNYDIENSLLVSNWSAACNPAYAIYPTYQAPPSDLEFQKVIGSGADRWPATPTSYPYSLSCALLDPLAKWYYTTANLNQFSHISHTYTHENLNNATYADAVKEITFNQAWMNQLGISKAKRFSANGLVPPAITGLHNGDAIRAWMTNGIKNVVGDNTRPVLTSPYNDYWPVISNVSTNGYDGLTIMPRWASPIYFDCDTPDCTTSEWNTHGAGGGSATFQNLLDWCRSTFSSSLLRLRHDPFMFHQANMRASDFPTTTIGAFTGKMSIMMSMVETVLQEYTRLVTWPVLNLKHDDLAQLFTDRMTRDKCSYNLAYTFSTDGKTIIAVTVTATNNKCTAPIPITLPVKVGAYVGGTLRQETVGSDPLTVWVNLIGLPVVISLASTVTI
jgi:hypothetical protein